MALARRLLLLLLPLAACAAPRPANIGAPRHPSPAILERDPPANEAPVDPGPAEVDADAPAPAPAPAIDCSSVPVVDGPEAIRKRLLVEGFAALPCILKHLGVSSTPFGHLADDPADCVVDGKPCASIRVLPASPAQTGYVVVWIHPPQASESHQYLAFHVAGPRPRFLGAFEASTRWLGEPTLRMERLGGRGPFLAVAVRPRCGTGCGYDHETWYDLEHRDGGSLKKVLDYPTQWWSVGIQSPVNDIEVTGRIVRRGVVRGEPAIDVSLEENHDGSVPDPRSPDVEVRVRIFARRGVARYRYQPEVGAFAFEPSGSTLSPAAVERALHGYESCAALLDHNRAELLAVAKRGSAQQRTLLATFLGNHDGDEECEASPVFAELRGAR